MFSNKILKFAFLPNNKENNEGYNCIKVVLVEKKTN